MQKLRHLAVVSLCTMILPLPLLSQVTSSQEVVRQPEALNILTACYASMGSPDETFTLSIAGFAKDADHPNLESRQISAKMLGMDRLRREERIGAKESLSISNGARLTRKRGGRREVSVGVSFLPHNADFIPAFLCNTDKIDKQVNIIYVGRETRNGDLVDHIAFAYPGENDGSVRSEILKKFYSVDIFLTASNHVVSEVFYYAFDARAFQNSVQLQSRFSDYRVIGGVLIPHHIERSIDSHLIDTTSLNTATNGGVSLIDFTQ